MKELTQAGSNIFRFLGKQAGQDMPAKKYVPVPQYVQADGQIGIP